MSFEDKAVLVTGGTRGIGAATALAFRAAGARFAVGGRSETAYRRFTEEHGPEGIHAALGELGPAAACQAVVATAVEALGGLDVLVNSAGVYLEAPFAETDEALWRKTIEVNLAGSFFCSQAALPALGARGGNIVNIASESGLIGYMNAAAYCASKGGVVNLTRTLALELAGQVRVNCVCPGNVDTDMIREAAEATGDSAASLAEARVHAPLGRMARPEEIAGAVLYLASESAGFTTGAVLAVDGGRTAG
jgi:NAD(P)-dependent dehydrogenase (short-subunit alcohol dehydrogenase family)